ncbi:hypothetical protein H6G41_20795 [Tolypothrix sp. FACHB-123]|uniref:hypothetical protein n=1 Tax=Tolypothrix sp. FACHB-123 TaxID=2692868 RepID=UPI001687161B|nr:hypothetical protein [Tolypothrix sp. FACHB-123]MBD2357033.1 hypothetical protein [Tolypothrix sp. FACHB-123]
MNAWNYEGFWNKAKVYISYGNDVAEDNPLFPFWYFLALELLGRSVLAKVHPVLLADSKDDSILYAFERPTKKAISISINLVFQRCQSFVKGFTKNDCDKCIEWMDLRNIELHTGEPIFHNIKTSKWLADYYRICKILLEFQDKTLDDYFGINRAEAARKAIEALKENVKGEVSKAISDAKAYYEKLTPEEISERKLLLATKFNSANQDTRKMIPCPVCGSEGIIQGKILEYGDAKIIEGEPKIIRSVSVLPTKFECVFCRFSIDTYAALHTAEIGGQYTVQTEEDMSIYLENDYDEPDFYMDE